MNPRPFALVTLCVCFGAAVLHGQTGGLDPTFGTGGRVVSQFGPGADALQGLALAPDGTLVAVGLAFFPGHDDFAIARYSADGQLIAAATIDIHPNELINDEATRVAILPDGRIVVAGITASSHAGANYDVALLRLLPTLAPDPTFGDNGTVITPFSGFAGVNGLAIQTDGRILLTGRFGIRRYNDDGSVDVTFGAGGRIAPVFSSVESVQGLALQADGRIIVIGIAFDLPASEISLARYRSDGSPDTTFGANGKVFLSNVVAVPSAVVVQPDDRITVAGTLVAVGASDFAVWRFEPDGQLDTSFGSGGRVFTDFGASDFARAIALQPDGRIVAAGLTQQNGDLRSTNFAVARYEANGDLDARFGAGGLATTDFFGEPDFANAVVIEPGRGVVVGGVVGNPNNCTQDFGLARYDGQPPNQPPVISSAVASRSVLWPPNHTLVDVTIGYEVTDDLDAAPACALSATSNEPVDGAGDGTTAPDWQVTGAHHVRLRAERSGGGTGRTYTIAITCTDTAGLQSQQHVLVRVPKSR
jgi:uncharacterized delta-60 repeat protein